MWKISIDESGWESSPGWRSDGCATQDYGVPLVAGLTRPDKHGKVAAIKPLILRKLGLSHSQWHQQMLGTETRYWRAIGSAQSLIDKAAAVAQRRLKGIGSAETDATSIDLIDRFQLQNQSHSALHDVLVACERFCMVAVRGLNGLGCGFVVISFCKPSAWIIKSGALPVASV